MMSSFLEREFYMRDLTPSEHHHISGGFFFVDSSTLLSSIRKQAAADGAIVSFALTSLTGIAFWTVGATVATTLTAGAVVAPYALLLGYSYSGAWSAWQ